MEVASEGFGTLRPRLRLLAGLFEGLEARGQLCVTLIELALVLLAAKEAGQ